MQSNKTISNLVLAAAILTLGPSLSFAEEPKVNHLQAELDADLAKSKIRDLNQAERGSNAAQDIDTAQQLGDQAKIQAEEHKLYHAEDEEENLVDEEEYTDEE